eukprot:g53815.t1
MVFEFRTAGRGESFGDPSIFIQRRSFDPSKSQQPKSMVTEPAEAQAGRPERWAGCGAPSPRGQAKPNNEEMVVSVRDTELLHISRGSFHRLFAEAPDVMLQFSAEMTKRLEPVRLQHRHRGKNNTTIALLPIDVQPETFQSLQRFSEELAEVLSSPGGHGRTALVTMESAVEELGAELVSSLDEEIAYYKAVRYLAGLEETYDYVILQCMPIMRKDEENKSKAQRNKSKKKRHQHHAPAAAALAERETQADLRMRLLRSSSAWNRLCISQADSVVLVGLGGTAAVEAVSRQERKLLWRHAVPTSSAQTQQKSLRQNQEQKVIQDLGRNVDLVLLWPDRPLNPQEFPLGTRRWLEGRQLDSHHHLRLGNAADLSRFGRFLSGTSIGLVFSGGGSKGLAHLGVLQAMDELGVPVDVIGGCSQGAMMAAMYAQHMSPAPMLPLLQDFVQGFRAFSLFRALTFMPVLSYFSGHTLSRAVQKALGRESWIEDLFLPYFCVSTNIKEGDQVVHRSGVLWRAVRASMTILGMVPPMIEDGEVLIDGGYVNNLPLDVLANYANTLIAVDVEDKDKSAFEGLFDYGEGISGFRVVYYKWFGGGGNRVPQFSELMSWLVCLNHLRLVRAMCDDPTYSPDVYIRPSIEPFKLLDYLKLDEIRETGYQAARAALEAWLPSQRVAGASASVADQASLTPQALPLEVVSVVAHHADRAAIESKDRDPEEEEQEDSSEQQAKRVHSFRRNESMPALVRQKTNNKASVLQVLPPFAAQKTRSRSLATLDVREKHLIYSRARSESQL